MYSDNEPIFKSFIYPSIYKIELYFVFCSGLQMDNLWLVFMLGPHYFIFDLFIGMTPVRWCQLNIKLNEIQLMRIN